MPERQVQKVCPGHSIEFIDPAAVPESALNSEDTNYTHVAAIPYEDLLLGENRLAVIRSNDERLIKEMSEAASLFRQKPISEEQISRNLSIYATRLPVASIVFGSGGSRINCEEPSCKFYVGGGCTNEDVMIQDDCGDAQYCMTYELDDSNK